MKTLIKSGFTIVETMLFLGVSALLIMGILVGTGSSINTQRYRDSVTSLQLFLQQQYSDVSNVNNIRTNLDSPCDGSALPIGQSDCVILGRYITSSNGGKTLIIKSVVGHIGVGVVQSSYDITAFQQYNITTSTVNSLNSTYDIEWGSSIIKPVIDGGGVMNFSILMLRSPSSGVTRTFIDSTQVVPDTELDLKLLSIPATLTTNEAKLCIDSNGLLTGNRTAVVIKAGATNASSVEILKESTSGC